MTESRFLEVWGNARKHYLNQPTFIRRLKYFELHNLKEASLDFTEEEIIIAVHGLFKQRNKMIKSMFLTPSHFLENITKYYTAEMSKEYQLYGVEAN